MCRTLEGRRSTAGHGSGFASEISRSRVTTYRTITHEYLCVNPSKGSTHIMTRTACESNWTQDKYTKVPLYAKSFGNTPTKNLGKSIIFIDRLPNDQDAQTGINKAPRWNQRPRGRGGVLIQVLGTVGIVYLG